MPWHKQPGIEISVWLRSIGMLATWLCKCLLTNMYTKITKDISSIKGFTREVLMILLSVLILSQVTTQCTLQPFNISQSASRVSALTSTIASFVSQNQVITFQSPKTTTNTNPFYWGHVPRLQNISEKHWWLDSTIFIWLGYCEIWEEVISRQEWEDSNSHVCSLCYDCYIVLVPTDVMGKLNTTHLE